MGSTEQNLSSDAEVTRPRARSSARAASDVAGLVAVFGDDVNIVTFPRVLDADLVDEATRVLAEPSFQLLTSVINPMRGPGALIGQMRAWPLLAQELHFWSEMLAELTGSEIVGVRLARLDAAMCPRFHVDRVMIRVVSTFIGHGTEYLAAEDVDSDRFGDTTQGASDENSGLLKPGAQVRRANAGDVILLKGEAWPNNAGRGVVHRSPIASRTSPRLVMTLDPLG